ncbi:MAG: RnfH family protein [Rubrivivax sp.]
MASADRLPALLQIEVVYCPQPGQVDQVLLQLPAGATLADALQASGVLQRHGLVADGLRTGIWCKPKDVSTPLREHDRVEIYRPLTVDPKEARRQRYKRHKTAAAAP